LSGGRALGDAEASADASAELLERLLDWIWFGFPFLLQQAVNNLAHIFD